MFSRPGVRWGRGLQETHSIRLSTQSLGLDQQESQILAILQCFHLKKGTKQPPMLEGFIHTNVRTPDPIQWPHLCVHHSRESSFKVISEIRNIVLILFRHVNAGLILGSIRMRSQTVNELLKLCLLPTHLHMAFALQQMFRRYPHALTCLYNTRMCSSPREAGRTGMSLSLYIYMQ